MAVKKKLLLVNNFLQGGGVEKLMGDLIRRWHDRYELTVMTQEYDPQYRDALPPDVRYFAILPPKNEDPQAAYLKQMRNKVIHWTSYIFRTQLLLRLELRRHYDAALAMKEGWCMEFVSGMTRIPLKLAWVHTDYLSNYCTCAVFHSVENERLCMRRFRRVICVSEQIERSIRQVIGDPGNLLVRYNPIRVDEIIAKAQEPVVDVEPEDGPLFVAAGRLNHQKGYDILLEACHMLERDGLTFHVLVIGGEEPWSDEHDRLYRRQKQLGLKSVRFLGGRSNPYKYMKRADWFLSTSVFEGYSLVSQEAAVLDVPMLLTDCSGVREFLGDSEYGIVMEISVLGVYENMKRVIEHPELREHYRKKITERKKIINFDERIAAIEELFDKDQAE